MKKIIVLILLIISCAKIFSQPTCQVTGSEITRDCPTGYYCPVDPTATGGPMVLECKPIFIR